MSEQITESKNDTNKSTLPNQSFFAWLKSQTALFISQIVGLGGVAYAFADAIKNLVEWRNSSGSIDPGQIQDFIIYAHIPFLLLFIVKLLDILDSNSQNSGRAHLVYERIFEKKLGRAELRKGRVQLRELKKYFLYFWLLMLVLYSSFIFQKNSRETPAYSNKSQIIEKINEANMLTNKPQVEAKIIETLDLIKKSEIKQNSPAKQEEEQPNFEKAVKIFQETPNLADAPDKIKEANQLIHKKKEIKGNWFEALNSIKYDYFIFAANNLSVLFIFWSFTIVSIPWHTRKNIIKARRVRNAGTVTVVIITALFPAFLFLSAINGVYFEENLKTYVILADAFSGLLNAIIVALFIARLDSKLIGLPSYLISVLYAYSAIQPLFVFFEQPGELPQMFKAFVFIVVFIFKIYFFLIITYAIQTGRMLDYLVCFPKLFGRVDSIFKNEFQFKNQVDEKGFKILIENKGNLVYTGYEYFETIEAYKEEVRKIKKLMKNKDLYKPKEDLGSYRVEFFWDKKFEDRIFSSINLESQDEMKDLIIESVANIPYCKVN